MAWTYIDHESGSAGTIVEEILNTLKNFSGTPRAAAKVALSDQRSGAARGVVFVNADISGEPPKPTSAQQVKIFKTSTEYVKDLYSQAAILLSELPKPQAFWARATMTNLKEGTATLEIWY